MHSGTVVGKLEGDRDSTLGWIDCMRDRFIKEDRSRGIFFDQDFGSMPGMLPVASGGIHVWHMPALVNIFGAEVESIFQCLGQGQCDGVTSRVARVDPDQLTTEEIVRYPSNEQFILGTVALEVNDEIWLGGIAGADRIVRFRVP